MEDHQLGLGVGLVHGHVGIIGGAGREMAIPLVVGLDDVLATMQVSKPQHRLAAAVESSLAQLFISLVEADLARGGASAADAGRHRGRERHRLGINHFRIGDIDFRLRRRLVDRLRQFR